MQQTILFNFNEKRMKEVFLALLFEDVWIQTFGLRYLLLYLIIFFLTVFPGSKSNFENFLIPIYMKVLFFKEKSS